MRRRLDRAFRFVLIYEGLVLAARTAKPELRYPPAVSQLMWRLPRAARAAVGTFLCGYLFAHFMNEPRP